MLSFISRDDFYGRYVQFQVRRQEISITPVTDQPLPADASLLDNLKNMQGDPAQNDAVRDLLQQHLAAIPADDVDMGCVHGECWGRDARQCCAQSQRENDVTSAHRIRAAVS